MVSRVPGPRTCGFAAALVTAVLFALPAQAASPRITIITDSVGQILDWDVSTRAVLSADLDIDFHGAICRKLITVGCPPGGSNGRPNSALDEVRRLGPELGKVVVLDVGYNDSPDEVERAVGALLTAIVANGVSHVVWVNYANRPEANARLAAAATRWPQLTVADWSAVSSPHPEWFIDDAHLQQPGGIALALFLHPLILEACGDDCRPPKVFCGLARTIHGFVYVRAMALGCAAALPAAVLIVRGRRESWTCAPAPDVKLTCLDADGDRIDLLARSPVDPIVANGVVTLANWSFRVKRPTLQFRESGTKTWRSAGRAPWCAPAIPQEVLTSLRLRPRGACFR